MFYQPSRDNFVSYADYAFAAVGYAMAIEGNGIRTFGESLGCRFVDSDCVPGGFVSPLVGAFYGTASTDGSEVCLSSRCQCLDCVGRRANSDRVGVLPTRVESVVSSSQLDEKSRGVESPGESGAGLRDSGQLNNQVYGKNTLRNRANRVAQRERKLKRKSMNQDWRKREVVKEVGVGSDGPSGFWNSCDESVRRELINSKARMHIAENKRREQEASDKYDEMTSAYGTMKRCVQMAEFAQKQAVKEKDGKIYGWANTVASSSAESLARSAPSSVPSFDELSAKLEASSQSSYEAELQAKIEEFKEECRVDKLKSAILAEDAKQALERLKIDNVVDEKQREQAQKVKDQKDKAIHDQLIAKIKYLENEMIGYREPTTINLRNHRYARGF